MAAGLKSDNVNLVLNSTGTGTDVVFQHNGVEIAKASQMIGVGQTWVNETANRQLDTTYTNTTGKPIMISVTVYDSADKKAFYIYEQPSGMVIAQAQNPASLDTSLAVIIPNGISYSVGGNSAPVLSKWLELK